MRPYVICIGLNPSTANAETDDNTIRNLTALLNNNGYGGLYMMNLFALISPDPEALRKCPDPVKENNNWIDKISRQCETVVFCWGNFKQAQYQANKIVPMFPKALCIGKNRNGSPKHPLYIKQTTKLIPYGKDI